MISCVKNSVSINWKRKLSETNIFSFKNRSYEIWSLIVSSFNRCLFWFEKWISFNTHFFVYGFWIFKFSDLLYFTSILMNNESSFDTYGFWYTRIQCFSFHRSFFGNTRKNKDDLKTIGLRWSNLQRHLSTVESAAHYNGTPSTF